MEHKGCWCGKRREDDVVERETDDVSAAADHVQCEDERVDGSVRHGVAYSYARVGAKRGYVVFYPGDTEWAWL